MARSDIFDLERWLKSLQIPFLYGINYENPWLEELSDCADSGVFVRQYFCSADSCSIDGFFQFRQVFERQSRASLVKEVVLKNCAIGCNNYKNPLNAANLKTLVSKAIAGKKVDPRTGAQQLQSLSDFFIIFSDDIDKVNELSQLRKTCFENCVNLHAIRENTLIPGEFLLDHFHRDWRVFEEPKSIGIIILTGK